MDIDGDGDLGTFVGNPFGLEEVGEGGAYPTFADIDSDGNLNAFIGNSSSYTSFLKYLG